MGTLAAARAPIPPALIVWAAVLGSGLAGVAMGRGVALGIAVVVALVYVPLVLVSLPLGIALWVPLAFLTSVDMNGAPQLAGLLIAFAWFGALSGSRSSIPGLLRRHGRLISAHLVLVGWVVLSTAWAAEPAIGSDVFIAWLVTAVILVVVVTSLRDPRHLRLVSAAFVVGALASVSVGLIEGGLQPTASALETAGEEGRLGGGSGDPNLLAAQTVPALILALGLAVGARPLQRLALVPVGILLIVGFAAAQSRGGLLAAVAATLAYLILARRERGWVVVFVLCAIGAAFAWFSLNPGALDRITSFDGGGTGRAELWRAGSAMWQDHPIVGVGIEGFQSEAVEYARRLGPLNYSSFIAEEPHVVHNTYLQMLAETGIVGFLLFMGVVLSCLRTGWRAAVRFDHIGDASMAVLARAVVVAGIATLAASFFLSNPTDRRTWVLLALGPALLATAGRASTGEAPVGPAPRSMRF